MSREPRGCAMPGCCAAVERIEELELMLRGRRAELGHTRAALTTSRDGHRAAQRVIAELEAERAELRAEVAQLKNALRPAIFNGPTLGKVKP